VRKIFNPSVEALVALRYLMFVIVVVVLVKGVLAVVPPVPAVVVHRATVLAERVFLCAVSGSGF
jgi:hypothetical protein